MAAEKEGAVVTKGHDEGMKAAAALLEEFGLPPGLLPLEDVTEGGVRAGHRLLLARAAQEGGAPVPQDRQAGELRRRDRRLRPAQGHQEAQGGQGQGARALAARPRDGRRRRPAHRQDPLQEPRRRHQDLPR
uniref:Uncharacterized protein n=1 Tax=Zea mays TaxID=4577 RepID=B6TQT5_MAIZE|nr:hypothetical protein [Zea mays]